MKSFNLKNITQLAAKNTKRAKDSIYRYTYRNLPCTDMPYSVCGNERNGGSGVLEWCFSEADAKYILSKMQLDSRFSGLYVCSEDVEMDSYEDDFDDYISGYDEDENSFNDLMDAFYN